MVLSEHTKNIHHQPINVPTAGDRPSLWISHKENGTLPTTRALARVNINIVVSAVSYSINTLSAVGVTSDR
jgi:hypothetical protein